MKRPLLIALTCTLLGAVSVLIVSSLKGDVNTNETRILDNQRAIVVAEFAFCRRLQEERDATNRSNAIIFVVLRQVASNTRRLGRVESSRDYARLAALTQYHPPTNCARAVGDAARYRRPAPIPFSRVDGATLARVLGVPVDLLLRAFGVRGG